MKWSEIREKYPRQWLLVEAISAHSAGGKRLVDDLAVVDTFPDGVKAMRGYAELHHRDPSRELYFLHTDRETIDITESHWFGIRAASRCQPARPNGPAESSPGPRP